jgi:hypothetical protein
MKQRLNIRQEIDKLQFSEKYIRKSKQWYPEQKKLMKRIAVESTKTDKEFLSYLLKFDTQEQWINTFSDYKLIKSFIIKARQEYNAYIKEMPKQGYIPLPNTEKYPIATMYFDRKIPTEITESDGTKRIYHNTFGKVLKISNYAPIYPMVVESNLWTNEQIWFHFYPSRACKFKFDLNEQAIETFKKLGKECLKTMIRAMKLSESPELATYEKQLETFQDSPLQILTNGYPAWFQYSIHKPINILETESRDIQHLVDLVNQQDINKIQSYIQQLKYMFPFATKFGDGFFQQQFTVERALEIIGIEMYKTFIITPYPITLIQRLKDFYKFIQIVDSEYIANFFIEYYSGHTIKASTLREAKEFCLILKEIKKYLKPEHSFTFQTNKHIYVYSIEKKEVPDVDADGQPLFINYLI